MKIRWSPEAAADFAGIIQHIQKDSPQIADRIARTVYDKISALATFPRRGRSGRLLNTRELVLSPLPFIAVYRVERKFVEIARVLHGAQRWP